ncbi:MAG: hypothetical protein M9951_15590 [Burkholderiaceae bacterium]|nr:hypothetical protein [Burkholderiaceae bacterium]
MSDWEYLYEMHDRGYSPEEIADAAGSGVAPWEWEYISREWVDHKLEDEPGDDAYAVKQLSPTGAGMDSPSAS